MTCQEAVQEESPQVPVGDDASTTIASAVEGLDRFAVLVVRIDHFEKKEPSSGEAHDEELAARLSRILQGMAKTRSIISERLAPDRFAVLCPSLDEPRGVDLAKEIQRRFSLNHGHTVSVGLAVFPFWPFEKETVLANAEKALDHAAFFGPDTVTPFDAVSLNISADKLYQYGDMDGAVEEFKKALLVDGENVNVHNSLGVCYGVLGKHDLAIQSFEKALRLTPKDVMATYNLGLAHLKKGEKDRALALFVKAHELDGDNSDIAYQIGLCHQEAGDLDRALPYLEKAAEAPSRRSLVFRALAELYVALQRFPEACKAYEKAIKKNPGDAKSLSALGGLYGTMGKNLEIAVVLARESTVIEPENGPYRLLLGRLYLQQGNRDQALQELEKAQALGEECTDLIAEARNVLVGSEPCDK